MDLVKTLLLDIAHKDENVTAFPPPEVWFMSHGSSSLDFELVCWFESAAARWVFITQVRYEMDRVFAAHGIEIPFPQRTLGTLGGKPLPIRLVADEPSPAAPGNVKLDDPPAPPGRSEAGRPTSAE